MIWKELSPSQRNKLQEKYKLLVSQISDKENYGPSPYNLGRKEVLEATFGKENLESAGEEVGAAVEDTYPKVYYKTSVWLNPDTSPSTGSVVCFDGEWDYDDGRDRYAYLEISDCHQKIRLHKCNGDRIEDFLEKLKLLRRTIDGFINHLKE